jgi:uncharacterized protein YbaP (TraB family)
MMRSAITFGLTFLISISVFAQKNKKPDHKLLWKISGNGLTKPSYLFGTMHVQDNRAFNFNDSVLTKIAECDAFALEVHPDSVTRFIASVILEGSKDPQIESLMTPKEFRHYDSLMKKTTGLSLRKFKSLKQAKYFLETRNSRKDKNTFLDAWLYNIAREKNKAMTGLEDFRAQMKLTQSDDSTEFKEFKGYLDAEKSYIDKIYTSMFDLYFDGDVEGIYEFSKANTREDVFKRMIIDRNINMTESIVREVGKHTLFSAVGAAHLGGQPGIINLLREKGYTVTSVAAPFTNTASKYKSNPSFEKWVEFTSDEGGYSVEMPQSPMPIRTNEVPITFQSCLDIGKLTFYMVAHIPVGATIKNQEPSNVLENMIDNIGAKQKVHNSKRIMVDGFEGREIESVNNDIFFRIRLIIRQSNVYMLMVGPSKEAANTAEAKRFLSSLKTKNPVNSATESIVNKIGAFAVDMPGKVTTQVSTPLDPGSGKKLKINIFFSADNTTGSSFIVRYNDFPAGYISQNDSSYFHNILSGVYEHMKGIDLTTDTINFRGYNATHFSFYTSDRSAKAEGIVTFRGERFYLLLNTRTAAGEEESANAFFNSFRFLPFEQPSLKKVFFPNGFSLEVPDKFEGDSTLITEENGASRYAFVDALSGITYTIIHDPLSKYEQSKDIQSYFSSLPQKYGFKPDEILRDSAITGEQFCHEYVMKSEGSSALIRLRAFLAGNSTITIWAYVPADYQELKSVDKIVNSFRIDGGQKSDWSLFADKSDVILQDIMSEDSVTNAEAKAAFEKHEFNIVHLPKIYRALSKSYGDDAAWSSTRNTLLNVLSKINDGTTEKFICDLYPTLPDSTSLKDRALKTLTSLKTNTAARRMIDLIASDSSGHLFNAYLILFPLQDSLSLLNEISGDLLTLVPRFENSYALLKTIRMALDSNAFRTEQRADMITRLTQFASTLADTRLEPDNEGYSKIISDKYNTADILFSIPFTDEIKAIISKIAAEDDNDIKLLCAQLLLKNNADPDPNDLERLGSERETRLALYEELAKYNKLGAMNKKYTTQRMLAESELLEYLSYEDELPESINFLKERNIVAANGEKQKVFIFTYRYEESGEPYIAIAGSYLRKSKDFKRGDLTTSFYEKFENEKQLNQKLTEYLEKNNFRLAD